MNDGYILRENIIHLLGLEALPDEDKTQMIKQMTELLHTRLLVRVMDILTAEQKAELEKLGQDAPSAMAYLSEHIPDFGALINREVVDLKKEMMEAAGQ